MNSKSPFFRYLSIFFCLLVLLAGCKKSYDDITTISSDIVGQYIAGHSPSQIDITDPFHVLLTKQADTTQVDANDVISITPRISTRARWVSPKEIKVYSKQTLKPDQEYVIHVHLDRIVPDINRDLKMLNIKTRTLPIEIQHIVDRIYTSDSDPESMIIVGRVASNMKTDNEEIESAFAAAHDGGSPLKIIWTHTAHQKVHSYTISDIERIERKSEVSINLKSNKLNASLEQRIEIPKKGEFAYLNYQKQLDSSNKISLSFSEDLDQKQDISGLVSIEGYTGDLGISVIGNTLSIHPKNKISGAQRILVSDQLKSIYNNTLSNEIVLDVTLDSAQPAVKLIGQGVISPNQGQVIFPFEAIGLEAVDVELFKIYESNMMQFLENNHLDNLGYNLNSVGKVIHQQKIDLRPQMSQSSLDRWERYAVEISNLTRLDPSSLYQVRIGFRRAYTQYSQPTDENLKVNKNQYREIATIMQYPSYGYYEDRRDPTNTYYYTPNRFISRNILTTNIGLTAKLGKDKRLKVAALDLLQTEPMSDVQIDVYDQQKQVIHSSATANNGIAVMPMSSNPKYVIAKKGNDVCYLHLEDYKANSLTDFDISGKDKKKGIDGYIYGERGVWRPGDSIYLTFVLDDPDQVIPTEHPIRMRVYDVKGTLRHDQVSAQHIYGMYAFTIPTKTSHPTGRWKAEVTVGDQVFTKQVKVETVKPNRIKINYLGMEDELTIHKVIDLNLEAKWLHGADASGLEAVVDLRYTPTETTFEGYNTYEFDDPARKIDEMTHQIYKGKIDDQGRANITLKPNKNLKVPGKMKASVKTKVYEKSGNFSEDNMMVDISPYASYVGVKAPKTRWGYNKIDINENQAIQFVSVDSEGNPLANQKLKVGLYNARWRWWYNRNDNNLYSYNSSQHYGAIDTVTLRTDARGQAEWPTGLKQYGSHMIRVCDEQSGHCSGEFFYVGHSWHHAQGSDNQGASLRFTVDKDEYKIGDKMKVTLPSTEGAKILVSLENNTSIVREYWVDAQNGETELEIELTETMAPNLYVHLSMIQKYDQRSNDLPIRMYGVKNIKVNNADAQIAPVIQTAAIYEPSQKYTVQVSEDDGTPMAYTLAVVDEGLLDLTRFNTPNLYNYFFSKQSLGVKTWDVYDHVLSGYGDDIERVISIGGDGEIAREASTAKANRFVPVVHYSGPHYLESNGSNTHTMTMPNYVGAVRVMVIAKSKRAYGSTEKSVPVKKDLMVVPTLPRVLAPGEKLQLPVNVFAMSDKVKNVKVTALTSNNIKLTQGASRQVSFDSTGDQLTFFDVEVGGEVGIETIEIVAESGSMKATQLIEIEVRNPSPYRTKIISEKITPSSTKSLRHTLVGTPDTREAYLEASTIPDLDLEKRLRYLVRYPYGCVEQTTSSVFPQLYLDDLSELSQRQRNSVDHNIKAGIDRLVSFQNASGGLSYWPGDSTNQWGTTYAGHFLIEAQSKGHYVPQGMMQSWTTYQIRRSNLSQEFDLTDAYRLYTLALIGSPNWSAMNRFRHSGKVKDMQGLLLAAAYAIAGQHDIAKEVQQLALDNISYEPSGSGYTYGSSLRNKALSVLALSHINDEHHAINLIREIASDMGSDHWYSTQTTSMSLAAISKYISAKGQNGMQYELTIKGSTPTKYVTEKSIIRTPIDIESLGSEDIIVTNHSELPIFIRYVYYYKPSLDETFEWYDKSSHLKMSTRYTTMEGEPIDPLSIPRGTDFIVETTVTNPGTRLSHVKDLALHQVFPSGWEIQNDRISDQALSNVKNDRYDYRDIRDDRVYTFFDLKRNKSKTFRTVLTATYPGTFFRPDTKCQAMYDNEIEARNRGSMVTVTQ